MIKEVFFEEVSFMLRPKERKKKEIISQRKNRKLRSSEMTMTLHVRVP